MRMLDQKNDREYCAWHMSLRLRCLSVFLWVALEVLREITKTNIGKQNDELMTRQDVETLLIVDLV